MNYTQMRESATVKQKEALQSIEYRLSTKIKDLFEKEFGVEIDFRGAVGAAAYLLGYSNVDEKILTSDYVPKMSVSSDFIGEQIADARKAAGLTLKNVADKIGCTVNDMRLAEKGNFCAVSKEKMGQIFPELAEMIISGRC